MKSKKITKWKSILITLLLLLGAAVYFLWSKEEAKKFQEEYGQFTYYVPEYEPRFKIFENGNALAYHWSVIHSEEQEQMSKVKSYASVKFDVIMYFENGYFANSFMKLKDNPSRENVEKFNRNIPEKGEYWRLAIYKLNGQKLDKKELDIFKLVRSYNKDLIPSELNSKVVLLDYSTQKKYIPILLHHRIEKTNRVYYIDLKEDKVVHADEVHIQKMTDNNNFVYQTNLSDNLERKGITLFSKGLYLGETYLKKNLGKTLLAQKYPEIYKIMQGEDARVTFLNRETDVELVKNVTELFFPPGTNVFENVTIPAKYSVDGQDHVINSAEELQKYYKEGEN